MIITSTIEDVSLVNKVEGAIQNSLKKVNLPYTGLSITELDENRDGRYHIGGGLEVGYDNGSINLSLTPKIILNWPKKVLQASIDHEVCHCKDMEQGIYGREIFLVGDAETSPYYSLATEMYYSYTDQHCARRQIKEFGKDSFHTYHTHNLEDFFATIDQKVNFMLHVKHEAAPRQCLGFTLSLFKEYIKSDLDNYWSSSMKQSISQVAKKLTLCFDRIHDTDVPWLDKTRLLFYTGLGLANKIELVASYLTDNVVLFPDCDADALYKFSKNMGLENNCDKTLIAINDIFGIKW